jgi:hypothetical protein
MIYDFRLGNTTKLVRYFVSHKACLHRLRVAACATAIALANAVGRAGRQGRKFGDCCPVDIDPCETCLAGRQALCLGVFVAFL